MAEGTNVEVTQMNQNHIRIAGLMPIPENGSSIVMAGPMGMERGHAAIASAGMGKFRRHHLPGGGECTGPRAGKLRELA